MEYLYSLGLIIVGLFIFYITYKDGKKKKRTLTVSYIMHLNGYIGGIGLILIGLIWLLKSL